MGDPRFKYTVFCKDKWGNKQELTREVVFHDKKSGERLIDILDRDVTRMYRGKTFCNCGKVSKLFMRTIVDKFNVVYAVSCKKDNCRINCSKFIDMFEGGKVCQ